MHEIASGGDIMFFGDSSWGQLMEIFKVLGTPTVKEWPEMTKLQYYNFLMPQIKGTGLE